MARSIGSERRLRGGSGPRSRSVWCVGALVIPSAQCLQCWPQWFQRGQLLRWRQLFQRRVVFGGAAGTMGGQRLGGGQWPSIQLFVRLRGLGKLQFTRTRHNS